MLLSKIFFFMGKFLIISTIILPPMGVFMRFGLNRWLDILITGGLSIFYYIPGLIYGLVLIYS